MLKLFRYFGRLEWFTLLGIVTLIVLQVFLDLQLPVYMSAITTLLESRTADAARISDIGVRMTLVVAGSLGCSCLAGLLTARVALVCAKRLRADLFATVGKFSSREIGLFSIPSLITRTTSDVTQIQWFVARALQAGIKSPILAAWSIRRILEMNGYWSLTIGLTVVYMIFVAWIIAAFAMPRYNYIQSRLDDFNRIIRENLRGLRVVWAFNAVDYQQEKFDRVNETLSATDLAANRLFAIQTPGIGLAVNGMTLAVYWIGAALIASTHSGGEKIFSDMVVVSSYGLQIITAFILMALVIILTPRFRISLNRIEEVLRTRPGITDGDGRTSGDGSGSIRFDRVSFRHAATAANALEDISFEIRPGETIGIVGRIGSGKSTLFRLLMRFCDPTEGTVRLDGENVADYPLETLRDKFGYVPQKAVLFRGTVRSNIAFGIEDSVAQENLEEAARISQCTEFLEKLEDVWDAPVAQGGTNFSGGQKQRLSIARALCREAEIYLFDDSFSALDSRTEKRLRQALAEKYPSKTILIASQKIMSVKEADRIIVLDEGKMVGIAPHEELLVDCPVYREIVASQLPTEGGRA